MLLVLVQGLHAGEEWIGRLWEVFPPARFLTGLFSEDRESVFIIINTGFFLFGLWCWYSPVRKEKAPATGLIWFWTLIEMINGLAHPAWALYIGAYIPGLITAPVLLFIAIFIMIQMSKK